MYPNTITFNVVVYICCRCRYVKIFEGGLKFMLSKLTTKFAILHLKNLCVYSIFDVLFSVHKFKYR